MVTDEAPGEVRTLEMVGVAVSMSTLAVVYAEAFPSVSVTFTLAYHLPSARVELWV